MQLIQLPQSFVLVCINFNYFNNSTCKYFSPYPLGYLYLFSKLSIL